MEAEEPEKKKKDRPDVPLTRDAVIKRRNARAMVGKESPLTTLQEIFEETTDKSRFVGDTMFWKFFEDIDRNRVRDTKSVEYMNLRLMFFETIFYVVLLLAFTNYAFSMQSTNVYEARNDQLNYWGGCTADTGECRLNAVRDSKSFWSWLSEELVPRAFTNYPNGAPRVANITTSFPGNEFPLTWSPRFTGPGKSSLMLGTLRMKQVRVKRNLGCEVSKLYSHVFPSCWGRFSTTVEDKDDYRPRFVPTYLKEAFAYSEDTKTNQILMAGKMGTYPGGGYIIDFPVNQSESLLMIQDLKQWYWCDRATRAVIVEFSTLNTNVNIIVNNRILFEFGATGSVNPAHEATAAQVFFFHESMKSGTAWNVWFALRICIVIFAIQTLWCFGLMYKTCMNFLGGSSSLGRAAGHAFHLFKHNPLGTAWKGFKLFFRTFYHFLRYEWNMLDFLSLTMWYLHLGFRYRTYNMKSNYEVMAPAVIGHPEKFMPFSAVMEPLYYSINATSIQCILVWMKSLKYLCMSDSFRLLVRILEKCVKELAIFSVVLILVFVGFSVCFFVAYGNTDENFSTLSGSFLVLFFRLMDGYRTDPWWFAPGKYAIMPVVFFCYMVLMYFVLLNVFLGTVLDTYAVTNHLVVHENEKLKGKPNPMVVFMKTFVASLKGISLVHKQHEENMSSKDLSIDLELLPGLVRRKWIEKKRKMQRVADESFAGLTLFPEDEGLLFQQGDKAGSDWSLPNSKMDITKMLNAQPTRPIPIYQIPQGILTTQSISRQQLQRLMDEDDSLPLLLGCDGQAVKVIRRFRRKTKDEEGDDFEEPEEGPQGVGFNVVEKAQADVFRRIDELERVPPKAELPKIPQIVHLTEEMSGSLGEVQNQFRVQLTGIIEATATLFEHLVELTQGLDAVRNNHEEVIQLVKEAQQDEGDGSSMRTGSQAGGGGMFAPTL